MKLVHNLTLQLYNSFSFCGTSSPDHLPRLRPLTLLATTVPQTPAVCHATFQTVPASVMHQACRDSVPSPSEVVMPGLPAV